MTNVKRLLFLIITILGVLRIEGQSLVAYHVVGHVTYTKQGKTLPLVMNTTITGQTVVNIPYNSKLELLDEKGGRRITLQQPGKGTVNALMESQHNSISKLTGKYISYVKRQLTNKGLVSRQRYTDMATVTRQRDSIAAEEEAKNPLAAQFEMFKSQSKTTFEDFREKCNREYIEFVRKAWREFGSEPPVIKEKEQEVKPVIFNGTVDDLLPDNKNRLQENKIEPIPEVVIDNIPQPKPLQVIKEQPIAPEDTAYSRMPFRFFDTDMEVRVDEEKRFYIGELTPDRIADVLQILSTKEYDNLLYDCLKLREEHHFCDWAYLLMLKAVADQFCGEGSNEATLLLGYLYCQSGYKMRFAMDSTHLSLLVASRHNIYDKSYYKMDGENFYPLDDETGAIHICEAKYPQESSLSLYINKAQTFGDSEYKEREIKSERYPEINFKVKVGNGLIDFYDSYPTSYINDDFTTRWAMYAETPMEQSVKKQVYPVLKQELQGLTPLQATGRLLNLIQTGLVYKYDEEVWGGDRAFFAEETLYYPYCDCEDRAILFTRLVRDLLGLDCILIYYPGHLASAVNFPNEETRGDYFTYNGKDYIVCDPTFINAGVGRQMTSVDASKAVLIPLK